MTQESPISSIEARAVTRPDGNQDPPALWVAGARYPSGTEIWCAYRGGEDAWTTDRKLAATYQSETEGDAVPFWTGCDG